MSRHTLLALLVAPLVSFPDSSDAVPFSPGSSKRTVDLRGEAVTVFAYRPQCPDPSLLLVFHGVGQNARGYRDHARDLADRLCMIVLAPRFARDAFPPWRYQRGGIVRRGEVQDERSWTGNLVLELVDWAEREESRRLPYSLIGHSGGGQFLSRVAAFTPTQARRVVIANPSTYVLPSLETDAPYGFRGVYSSEARAEEHLRRYLAQPVTIYLGQADTGDKHRNDGPEARAQGETRYERGLNVFRSAKSLADARGWTFGWRLVEAPGVGHSARKMFSASQAVDALRP